MADEAPFNQANRLGFGGARGGRRGGGSNRGRGTPRFNPAFALLNAIAGPQPQAPASYRADVRTAPTPVQFSGCLLDNLCVTVNPNAIRANQTPVQLCLVAVERDRLVEVLGSTTTPHFVRTRVGSHRVIDVPALNLSADFVATYGTPAPPAPAAPAPLLAIQAPVPQPQAPVGPAGVPLPDADMIEDEPEE